MKARVLRPRVRIHFRNFLDRARADRPVHHAVAVGSVPPELHYVWNRLENERVDVRLLERGALHGREEGVDQLLQTSMLRDLSDYNGDGADFHSCKRRMREWAEEKGVFIALDDFYESVTSSVSGSWRENPRKGVQVRRACADT